MPDTTEADAPVIHACSPVEYIKRANARELDARHEVDLQHFVTFLQTSAGMLREMPADKVEVLVAEYLAARKQETA